jgi:O-antigen ligase
MFQDADAQYATEDNYTAYWRQTHNSFTQISSEEGLPALVFYCAAIFFCFRATRAAGKLARGDESRRWIGDLGFTLGLSLLAFVITGIFASNAYDFYFPFVAGLCAALERAVAVERRMVGPREHPG